MTSASAPILRAGDRLSRPEFERRYEEMAGLAKAELLFGVVVMPSPVRCRLHAEPHALLTHWLCHYQTLAGGTRVATDATVRLLPDTEVQPDLLLRRLDAQGGSRLDADGYLSGAPELVVEVAASSAALDLTDKMQAYWRAGVREYVVVRPEVPCVDWFVWSERGYAARSPEADGCLGSAHWPGLRLDVAALLRGDAAALVAAVPRGGSA